MAGISRTSALEICFIWLSSSASSNAGSASFSWNTASSSGSGSRRARSAWTAAKCSRSTPRGGSARSLGGAAAWVAASRPLPLPLLVLDDCPPDTGGGRGASLQAAASPPSASSSSSSSPSSLVVSSPSEACRSGCGCMREDEGGEHTSVQSHPDRHHPILTSAASKQAYRRLRSARKPPIAPKTLTLWTRWQLAPYVWEAGVCVWCGYGWHHDQDHGRLGSKRWFACTSIPGGRRA